MSDKNKQIKEVEHDLILQKISWKLSHTAEKYASVWHLMKKWNIDI